MSELWGRISFKITHSILITFLSTNGGPQRGYKDKWFLFGPGTHGGGFFFKLVELNWRIGLQRERWPGCREILRPAGACPTQVAWSAGVWS